MQLNVEYDKYKDDYQDLSDFFAGERQIKAQEERYTPMLEGQVGKLTAYERYVGFGILFNFTVPHSPGTERRHSAEPADIKYPEGKRRFSMI